MSGFFTGRTGSIEVAGNIIMKCRDWSLEATVELLSTNTIDTYANTFVPGVKGATGSATLLYYRKQSNDPSQEKDASWIMNKSGLLRKGAIDAPENQDNNDRVFFVLNVGTDPKDDISFYGYVTSIGVTVSTGELCTVPINFTVDGEYTDVPGT